LGYPLLVVVVCVAGVDDLETGCVAIILVHLVGYGGLAVCCDVPRVCEAGGYLALEYC
jgi:hypothetical protein